MYGRWKLERSDALLRLQKLQNFWPEGVVSIEFEEIALRVVSKLKISLR
jgi:hypothetical protein